MSGVRARRRAGIGWLVLMAVPPLLVVAGLVVVLVGWGSRGGITPKWKQSRAATNAAPPSVETR